MTFCCPRRRYFGLPGGFESLVKPEIGRTEGCWRWWNLWWNLWWICDEKVMKRWWICFNPSWCNKKKGTDKPSGCMTWTAILCQDFSSWLRWFAGQWFLDSMVPTLDSPLGGFINECIKKFTSSPKQGSSLLMVWMAATVNMCHIVRLQCQFPCRLQNEHSTDAHFTRPGSSGCPLDKLKWGAQFMLALLHDNLIFNALTHGCPPSKNGFWVCIESSRPQKT